MSTISFGGLASGIDTGSIISELLEIKRQPIYRLEATIQNWQAQQTATEQLKARVEALRLAAADLDDPQEFASLSAISSNEALVSATAGSTAMPGSFDMTVNSLAAAQKDMSQGFDSLLTEVGTGLLSIGSGGESVSIVLEAGANSLADVRDAINASGAAVYATIMYDGSETGGYHLVLTAEETGTDSTFNVGAGGLSGGAGLTLNTVTAAANAEVVIDTLTISSQTNTIANAIQGVTLDLQGAEPGTVLTLDVATDPTLLEDQVQSLVDAYNDLYSFIETQSAEGGILRGNALLRDVSSQVATWMSSPVTAATGNVAMLSQVGLSLGDGNLLEFELDTFNESVAGDFIAVRDLFAGIGENEGVMDRVEGMIDAMTDSIDGRFKLAAEGFDARIENAEDSIERYELSVSNYETLLAAKFTAMESIIAQLNVQSSYLTQYLGNLSNSD